MTVYRKDNTGRGGKARGTATNPNTAEGWYGKAYGTTQPNEMADSEAKAAAEQHPQQAKEATWQLEVDVRDVCTVLELATALLPLWPRLGSRRGGGGEAMEGLGVLQRVNPGLPPRASLAVTHEWKWMRGRWRCQLCYAAARGKRVAARARFSHCSGKNPKLARALGDEGGHKLTLLMVQDQPLLLCAACGAYGLTRLIKLLSRCVGHASNFGMRASRALKAGRLPKGEGARRTVAPSGLSQEGASLACCRREGAKGAHGSCGGANKEGGGAGGGRG